MTAASEASDRENPKDILGVKKSALRLVPPALAVSVAPVMALGARKYGSYNWRTSPVKLTIYLEAMLRHIYAKMDGEDLDPESGEDHLAHVGASVGIVLDAAELSMLIDDRPVSRNRGGPSRGVAATLLENQDQTAVPASQEYSAPVTPTHTVNQLHTEAERHPTAIGLVYPHVHGPDGLVWTTDQEGVEFRTYTVEEDVY